MIKKIHILPFFIYIALFSLIIPLVMSTMSFAETQGSPIDIAKRQVYYRAINDCMKGSGDLINKNLAAVDVRQDGIHAPEKYKQLVGDLQNAFVFSEGNGSVLVGSRYLELQLGATDQGGYSKDDGQIFCGENNNRLIVTALESFGTAASDRDNLKKLYCDGDSAGLLLLTKHSAPSGGNPGQVLDSNDCDGAFDLLYSNTNNKYGITASVGPNAQSHFQKFVNEVAGDFNNDLTDQQKSAVGYAKAVLDFQSVCLADGSQGPFDDPITDNSNAVEVWDAFSSGGSTNKTKWYVVSDLKKTFKDVDGKDTTCESVAVRLTKDGAIAFGALQGTIGEDGEATGQGVTDTTTSSSSSGGSEEEPNCLNSGGAKSLGWIVCPILDWMNDTTQVLYDQFIKPNLNVQPKLFTQTNKSGEEATHEAWNIFRNFANIVFVIIMLVVIFSQITGVGIDNYGIKKILPKLVVVAILVNLSFVLCEICVDVSNIVGNFIQSMLSQAGANLEPATSAPGTAEAWSTAISAVGIAGGVFLAGAAIWDNPAIVLTFFISLLGVVISIIFLFLLLAARQAAIVVLVVISPLAVICYALPNTKSLSDRWTKMFKGLLMVYPIAGLLVGGGDFVSKLLLSTGIAADGLIPAITAMVVGIVPIFFIPTVLKSAFAAMGNLGAMISGVGGRLSAAATRGALNSEAYKNAQASSIQRRTRHKAGLKKDGRSPNLRGRFKEGIANGDGRIARAVNSVTGTDRSLNRYRQQFLKDNADTRADNSLSNRENFERARAQQELEFEKSNVAAAEAQLAMGGMSTSDGKQVDINKRDTVAKFHSEQLAAADEAQKRYNNAQAVLDSETSSMLEKHQAATVQKQASADLNTALNNVRAAQNNLVQSQGGRDEIVSNYKHALESGQTGGLQAASAHMMSEHGGEMKKAGEGDNEMMRDLASTHAAKDFSDVQTKVDNHSYDKMGTDKYDADSLVAADSRTREGLLTAMGSMDDTERANIQKIARQAQSKINDGSINASAPTQDELKRIVEWRPPAGTS